MTDHGDARSRGLLEWLRRFLRGRDPRKPREPVEPPPRDVEAETLRVQLEIIRDAFDGEVGVAWSGEEFEYVYHPRRVLVRTERVEDLVGFFRRSPDYDGVGTAERLIEGLSRYHVPPRADGRDDALTTLEELDRWRPGTTTPDHLLYVVATAGKPCPATEPLRPRGRPVPAPSPDAAAGKGVRVSVVDTGWYPPAAKDGDTPWLATGVEGDEEQLATVGGDTVIHEYAGHGTFVAGVLKCLAPAADVEVEGFLTRGGAIWESDIARELNEAMTDLEDDPTTREHDPRPPDLISISAGSHTRGDRGLLAFEILARLYRWTEDGGPLVVAAAGNEGKDKRFYPAAYDWVVGVGSLDRDGTMSDFSNFGDWVDVYAHGRDLVNAFPTGTYTYVEPASGALLGTSQSFTGLARWSGTSFATPIVTGAIAAYMSEHGGSARAARDALLAGAATRTDPKVGTLRAVGPPFVP